MEKDALIELIKKSQAGDLTAIEELLQQAFTSVSYQCRKMLKNEQDAEDVTQEVLLAVYTKLNTLQEPAAFWGWLNRMTANRCMNVLTRSHVDLQIAEDEEGHSLLDNIEELDEQRIPDKALDNEETVRMIGELVEALPEAQRMCTLLYYYDEMSVSQIAKVMDTSENTVKSRLNYARKAIKEGVQDYEKKGVKLYGLSPLPFLLYFLRKAAQSSVDSAAAQAAVAQVMAAGSMGVATAVGSEGTGIKDAVVSNTAGAGTKAVTAGSTAGGHLLGGLVVKVTAGILAGIIAIGGVGVGIYAATGNCLRHEWVEATCQAPRTCAKCGKTEGEPLPHIWAEATCTAPKTCQTCGITEGDPIPHTWVEATCTEPKTCQICGITEGEPLGHTMQAANFQQAATCLVCGYTEGEPLEPKFVTAGRECNAALGVEYDYTVPTNANLNVTTTGTAVFSNYQVFPSSDTLPGKEGFEWRTVEVAVTFYDENAQNYGTRCYWLSTDFYGSDFNGIDLDESSYHQDETFAEDVLHFSVYNYGEVIPGCMSFVTGSTNGWQDDLTYTFYYVYHAFVPVGYDGCVFGVYDGYENEFLIDKMTLAEVEPRSMFLFRLN